MHKLVQSIQFVIDIGYEKYTWVKSLLLEENNFELGRIFLEQKKKSQGQ